MESSTIFNFSGRSLLTITDQKPVRQFYAECPEQSGKEQNETVTGTGLPRTPRKMGKRGKNSGITEEKFPDKKNSGSKLKCHLTKIN
jgi:hypothetical protein